MKQSWGVKKKRRNYVELWVFFLLVVSVNFFDLIPITRVIGPNGPFAFYLISLFLMFTFNRRAWIRDSANWLRPFWWLVAGIVLSWIPALMYYGQSFVQSFFSYRRMFELVAFPILIALRPSERELRGALYGFSVFYLIVSLMVTFFAPWWVPQPEDSPLMEEGDLIVGLSGVRHLSRAYICALERAIKDNNLRNMGWAFFEFALLFLVQNRTSLIAAIVIVGFLVLKMKMSSQKLLLIALGSIAILLMAVYTAGQWELLYRETVEQIFNPEYNRNKAYAYMFSHRSLLQHLLGTGYISSSVDPIIHVLQESGIFHSDVGMVGMWHQYGVIPTLVILVMTVKGLAEKKSFLVKASALYILVGIPTLSFFGIGESILWLSIFLYVYYSDGLDTFRDDTVTVRKVGWGGNRYRSIAG